MEPISADALSDIVQMYLDALNDSGGGTYSYIAKRGRTYIKVIQLRQGQGHLCVHAFIDRRNGDLIKAATRLAPQRNADGTLSVRYRLADEAERSALFEQLRSNPRSFSGSYLYLS